MQAAIGVYKAFRNGKIHGVKLVLVSCAEGRGLRTVEGMLYGKLNRFEVFHVTAQGAFCIFVRAVSLGKSRKYVRSANAIIGSRGCAVGCQLHTRNVIATGVAVYSVREGRAANLPVNDLELVKQIFIIAAFGF